MGEIGIFSDEKKKWIQFDEDTEVLIKLIGKEELRSIMHKAQKTANLTGADVNSIADRKLGEACVLGWRNISDHNHPGLIVNKQPLPFTPENVDMLMKKSIEFSRFVNDNAINSKLFMEEEADTKNA